MKNFNGKAVNFRPTLFIALSVIAGIFSAYCFSLAKTTIGIISLSVVFINIAVFLIFYSKGNFKRNIIFIVLVCTAFALSYLNFTVRYSSFQNANLGGTTLTVTARVCKYGKTDGGTKYVLDSVVFSDFADGVTDYKMALYLDSEERYVDIGDVITFRGYITDNQPTYSGSFSLYNVSQNIKYSCVLNTEDITLLGNSKSAFESVNVGIREQLKSSMNTDSFRIAYALLTGNSGEMDGEVVDNFRYAGVGHIFAVSGLHIGFVAIVIGFILKKLRANGLITLLVTGAMLVFYSGICLFTASSIRATVMTMVLLLSRAVKKKYDGLSSVSLASIIVLSISPMQLFDAGFILSFGIVTGALLFYRQVSRLFKFLPRKIAQTVSFAVTAQLIAIPLGIVLFNGFSSISIIVNIIFVPFVAVLFIFLMVALLIGWIFGIGFYTLFVPDKIFFGLNVLIKAFDYSVFYVSGIMLGAGVLLYFPAVVICSGVINLKVITRTILAVALLSAFAFNTVLYNLDYRNSLKITVVGNDYINCTLVSDSGEQTIIVNSATRGVHNKVTNALEEYGESITTAVFPKGEGADISNVVTGLRQYGIKTVYYSLERTVLTEDQLGKMFPNITFVQLTDGTVITIGKTDITVKQECNLTEIQRHSNDRVICVLSDASDDTIYPYMSEYEVLIVNDNPEIANVKASAKSLVSYRVFPPFVDAENDGRYTYRQK